MIREVLRMGDARLWRRANPVTTFGTDALAGLVTDLWDTMAARGGVGIAAPQIGVELRVVVFGFDASERYPDAPPVPRTVLINPLIRPTGVHEESDWEGCLSVPGLRGRVSRWTEIEYEGVDIDGAIVRRTASGFHARVVQHECDHLDGILYPLRITDLHHFGYADVLFPNGLPVEE
ncbi:MAG: peptide deformylase [Rhodocyclaceae bacterium]|nr:peptide deformylase [Rhodocyclaceae bacterium]